MTAEIALRHAIPTLDDFSTWPSILPFVQSSLNASRHSATGKSAHEMMYGLPIANPLTRLHQRLFGQPDLASRLQSLDLANYAQMKAKYYFDKRHEQKDLSTGDRVYIRLHKGYKIKSPLPSKLQPQRIGPFTIKRKVGRLAYELDLNPALRIHPVLSIAQLEPAPSEHDPFRRRVLPPGPLSVDGDDDHYEIEKILDSRSSRGRTEFLIKWKGYGDEHNVWYDESDLPHAQELIKEFRATTRSPLTSRLRPRRRT